MKQARVVAITLGAMFVTVPALAEEAKTATMIKPAQCGCCDAYAKYLERNGFKLKIESFPNQRFDQFKRTAAIPDRFQGCHTLEVDGYIVEGLVPIDTLNKLLTEKPKIRGISLPGMPVGAPGMPGRKTAPLVIYELEQGSEPAKEFARE